MQFPPPSSPIFGSASGPHEVRTSCANRRAFDEYPACRSCSRVNCRLPFHCNELVLDGFPLSSFPKRNAGDLAAGRSAQLSGGLSDPFWRVARGGMFAHAPLPFSCEQFLPRDGLQPSLRSLSLGRGFAADDSGMGDFHSTASARDSRPTPGLADDDNSRLCRHQLVAVALTSAGQKNNRGRRDGMVDATKFGRYENCSCRNDVGAGLCISRLRHSPPAPASPNPAPAGRLDDCDWGRFILATASQLSEFVRALTSLEHAKPCSRPARSGRHTL
jgi:hypothetical protein